MSFNMQLEQLGKNLHEKERKWLADTTREKAVAKYMKVVAATREEALGGTHRWCSPAVEVNINRSELLRQPTGADTEDHPTTTTARRWSRRAWP